MKRFAINHHYENSTGRRIVILSRTRRYLSVLYCGTVRNFLIRTDYTRGTEYITDGSAGADFRADYTWFADSAA